MMAYRFAPLFLLTEPALACSSQTVCPGSCPINQPAIFHLSCGPTDLSSVALSGPCAVADSSPSNYVFGATDMELAIRSPSAGQCHVTLMFANGFTYSADIGFGSQTDSLTPGCSCPLYTVPTPSTFAVGNPTSTCSDAGRDVAVGD